MKGRRPAELDDVDRQPRFTIAKPYGIDSDDEEQEHVRRMVEGEAAMAQARYHAAQRDRALDRYEAMRRGWWHDVRWIAVGLVLGEIGVWVWSRVF